MVLVCTLLPRRNGDAGPRAHAVSPFEVSRRPAAQDYAALVGLNVFRTGASRAFRNGWATGPDAITVHARGHTLPTLVIQSFAGEVVPVRDDGRLAERPAALDGCAGARVNRWRSGSAHWPRWNEPALHRPGQYHMKYKTLTISVMCHKYRDQKDP